MLYTNKDLRKLIIPITVDMLLQSLVGIADSIMVASAGETAVSSVSLMETVMTLVIFTCMALATGGSVVAGQYLGKKKEQDACFAANELLSFTLKAFLLITLLGYLGKNLIIYGIFGKIEESVAAGCEIYLNIVFASIPMIALYNSGAALFRVMGDSAWVMKVSMIMNGINVAGNALLIYGFHMGVAGAAIPTTVSRLVACVLVIYPLLNAKRQIHIVRPFSLRTDWGLLKKILYIGIPNAAENFMFQLGKILVLSWVSGFGTAAIAANAVCSTLERFVVLPGNAIGTGLMTVVSKCAGINDFDQVRYYTKKLFKVTYISMTLFHVLITSSLGIILYFYGLSEEANHLVWQIMIYHTICTALIWPLTFSFPYMLRAAGDVHFTLISSTLSMWIFRIGFSWLLGVRFGWGVFGIWVAMTIDWAVRSVCFVWRYWSGKWKHPSLV